MSAEEDARARREAWLAAGAPDYNAPTRDSSGNITGYVSVAAQPQSARSESNQSLQIVNGRVVDIKTGQSGPYYPIPAGSTVQWINQPAQPIQQPASPPTKAGSTNTGPATGSNPDDQLVSTCKGAMTVAYLRSQLQGANYPGPWDVASMVAAFNRAACPTLSGAGSVTTTTTTAGTGVAGGRTGTGGTDTTQSGVGTAGTDNQNLLLYGIAAIALLALLGGRR